MKIIANTIACLTFLFSTEIEAQIGYSKADGDASGSVLEYSPDGLMLLSGANNKISLWISTTGQLSKTSSVKGASKINDLAFWNKDTVCISTGGEDILLYDLKSSANIRKFDGHSGKVTGFVIDPESGHLFSGSMDKTTILWDIQGDSIIKRFKDHKGFVLSTAFSPATGMVASCGSDGLVNVYNRVGELLFSKQVSEKWLWSIAFSLDGEFLMAGGENRAYVLSGLDSQTPSVSELKGFDGNINSLKISPDGKFFAIGTSHEYVYLYEVEGQRKILQKKIKHGLVTDLEFTPDGKNMLTTHDYLTGLLKWDLRSLNIIPNKYARNSQDRSAPQIFISNPSRITEDRAVVYTDQIKLKGTVIDESGVYKVLVNSVNAPVSDNGSFIINLPLSFSENHVTIEAHDINNNVSLRRFTIARKDPSASEYDPALAKNYLLLIGINKYENFRPLNNAVNDINAIAGTLSGLYNFNFSDISLLTDSQATRNNIYNTLRGYAEKVGPKDNFVIYYSGHGYFDALLNEGYWIPVDAKRTVGDYLSNSDLLRVIRSINSQHTLLIADACFAGSLFNESSRGFIENVEKLRSRWGLASGRLEEVSDGEIGKNSPFARIFIDFLRNSAKEKIAVSEIIQFVKMNVPEGAKQTPIGNPLRNVGDDGGEFIFYKRN